MENISSLISNFEFHVRKNYEYLLLGNSKKGNTHFSKLIKIVEKIILMDDLSRALFLSLIYSDIPEVAYMAAYYNLKYSTDECIAVLKKLEQANIKYISMEAKNALKSWQKGTWNGV